MTVPPLEPGLRLPTSDRLEDLADDLVARLHARPLPPLETEMVVVGSRGMSRWLNLRLARELGIAASVAYPFPFNWARRTTDTVFGRTRDDTADPFGPQALPWRVHAWLGRIEDLDLESTARAPLERYLADDPDRRKRGQLARRVARLFVQYQTLRVPELLRWERGEWFGDDPDESGGEIWQRALWNALVDEADRPSLARDLDDGIGRLQRGEGIEGLPRRVTLFGLSSVPPVLLSLAAAVARYREVTIATLTPTREYIGDARSARRQPVEQGDLFEGAKVHPLLAEWGRVGRDLQDQLTELEGIHPEVQRETARERTVLGQLQQDLLDARMPADPDERAAPERVRVRPDDRSLRIHVCHSERREIEVLRDEILRAFEEGVVREPSDVLVLVPDIDRYAPFVRAVFESPRATAAGPVHLPVQVADGRDTDHSDFARFALDLLDHAGGRHTASSVLELLESGPVARRFGLDDVPTSEVHDLVRGAGIRFGRDPSTRAAEHDLHDLAGGTWREGLDRLVLGFALGRSDVTIDGVVPRADATTGRAETVGRLAIAADALFARLDRLVRPRSLRRWCEDLRSALFALTAADGRTDAALRVDLVRTIEALAEVARDDDTDVARSTFAAALRAQLADDAAGQGFVSGSITVAELRPMRSLPYAMIAVAGLDSDSFPRRDPAEGLDLTRGRPRRGDRSPRADDRQMLLEVLTSARRRLALTAIGMSQRDGTEIARSVCLDELVEVIDASFVVDADPDPKPSAVLTVEHRLQPFHAAYGRDDHPEHFTYARETVDAARALRSRTAERSPFVDSCRVDDGLVRDAEGRALVTVDDLVTFWRNPCRWFVTRVLGMSLHFDEGDLDDEPFGVDALGKYRIRRWMIDHVDDLPPVDAIVERAEHELGTASGRSGRVHAREVVETTLGRWHDVLASDPRPRPREVDRSGPTWRLTGTLDVDPAQGQVVWAPKPKVEADALIDAYVRHVILGATRGEDGPPPWATCVVAAEGAFKVLTDGVGDPIALLDEMIAGYVEGQRRPLRFFRRSTLAWCSKTRGVDDRFDLDVARHGFGELGSAWVGDHHARGDRGDDEVTLCMRGVRTPELIDDDFLRWARLFDPVVVATSGRKKAKWPLASDSKGGTS